MWEQKHPEIQQKAIPMKVSWNFKRLFNVIALVWSIDCFFLSLHLLNITSSHHTCICLVSMQLSYARLERTNFQKWKPWSVDFSQGKEKQTNYQKYSQKIIPELTPSWYWKCHEIHKKKPWHYTKGYMPKSCGINRRMAVQKKFRQPLSV